MVNGPKTTRYSAPQQAERRSAATHTRSQQACVWHQAGPPARLRATETGRTTGPARFAMGSMAQSRLSVAGRRKRRLGGEIVFL